MVICLLLSPPPYFPPSPTSTHSRVSAGMCSLSLRDFMPRPGLRLRGRVPKPPLWPPEPRSPCDRTDPQTRTWGQHAWPALPTRRGGWAAGGAGGGLSPPRGGARSPAPARRPSPAGKVGLQEAGVAGATPSRRSMPRLPGLEPPGCATGKEGRSLSSRLAILLHRLAPPLPGYGRVSALAPPPPGVAWGRGVTRTRDLSAT